MESGMKELTRDDLYGLLGGFYSLLWGQLDSLFDEHRWARGISGDAESTRTPEVILQELIELQGDSLPLSLDKMANDNSEVKGFVSTWKQLQGKLQQDRANEELRNQINSLHKSIQESIALFEERALTFVSLMAPTDQN